MNYAAVVSRLFGRVPQQIVAQEHETQGAVDVHVKRIVEAARQQLSEFGDEPRAVAMLSNGQFASVGRTHACLFGNGAHEFARLPEADQEVAGPTVRELTAIEQKNARMHLKRGRSEFRFGRFKPGMSVTWRGERWLVYDARARGGSKFTLMLVTPDYQMLADEVQPADLGEGETSEANVVRVNSFAEFDKVARRLVRSPIPDPDSALGKLHLGTFGTVDEAEAGGADGMRFGAARMIGGEKAIPFSSLPVGAKFRFPKTETVYVKVSDAGRYQRDDGQKFKTGQHTAVIPVAGKVGEAKEREPIDDGDARPGDRVVVIGNVVGKGKRGKIVSVAPRGGFAVVEFPNGTSASYSLTNLSHLGGPGESVDEEEGRWRTTASGRKIFIDGDGKITKGNPHVVKAASGAGDSKSSMSARYSKQADEWDDKAAELVKSTDPADRKYAEQLSQAASEARKTAAKFAEKEAREKDKPAAKSEVPDGFLAANGMKAQPVPKKGKPIGWKATPDSPPVVGYASKGKQLFALVKGADGRISTLTAGKVKEGVSEAFRMEAGFAYEGKTILIMRDQGNFAFLVDGELIEDGFTSRASAMKAAKAHVDSMLVTAEGLVDEAKASEQWAGWADWTPAERVVFSATVELKAGYGGVKDFRFQEANKTAGLTREQWDTAFAGLKQRGVLNAAGAVKPEWKKRFYAERKATHPSVSQGTRGMEPWESLDEAEQLPKTHKGKPWDDVVAMGKGSYIVKIWRGQKTKWAYSTTNPQGGGFGTTVETQSVMGVLQRALNISDKPERVWVVVGARKPTDPFDPFEVAGAFWFNTKTNLPESIDEASKFTGPIYTPETAGAFASRVQQLLKAPFVEANVSTLGEPTVMVRLSLDPRETWTNQIFHNSRWMNFSIKQDGTIEQFSKASSVPKFRKVRADTNDGAIVKLNTFLIRLRDTDGIKFESIDEARASKTPPRRRSTRATPRTRRRGRSSSGAVSATTVRAWAATRSGAPCSTSSRRPRATVRSGSGRARWATAS